MARIRSIKPEFWVDEKLNKCSRDARLLFIGLWSHSDDMGRQQYNPSRTKAQIFPDDDLTSEAIERWIAELVEMELIYVYKAHSQTQRYIWIPGFLRHQKIDKPGHSSIPPHPRDWRPECRCGLCKHKRLTEHSGSTRGVLDEYSSNRRNVPAGTHGIVDSSNPGISESSIHPAEVGSRKWEVGVSTTPTPTPKPVDFSADDEDILGIENTGEKEGFTDRRALEEFSVGVLNLLQLTDQTLKDTIIKSIKVKARSEGLSLEAAGQRIASRAAYIAGKAPPENWAEWFADARYQYVPEGDPRLQDKQIEARPTCGSNLCDNGWETVKVNGHALSRRCPDCLQLWQDANLD